MSDYGVDVQLHATPPVGPAVERALLEALEDMHVDESMYAYSAAWRLAALSEGVEGVEDADEPVRYAFSPRSTRGATRA